MSFRALLALALSLIAAQALAQFTFAPQVTYATGANPRTVAVRDLNADGRLDVVVATASPTSRSPVRPSSEFT